MNALTGGHCLGLEKGVVDCRVEIRQSYALWRT